MSIVAHATNGERMCTVELVEDGKKILKAYTSPDGTKIRIVLPELSRQEQVAGQVAGPVRYIEFNRKP